MRSLVLLAALSSFARGSEPPVNALITAREAASPINVAQGANRGTPMNDAASPANDAAPPANDAAPPANDAAPPANAAAPPANAAAPSAHAAAPSPVPPAAQDVPDATGPVDSAAAALVADEPAIEAYHGTLAEGLAEIEAFSDAEQPDAALAVVDALLAPTSFLRWRARTNAQPGWKKTLVAGFDPVLDLAGLHALPPAHRAAVEYARGVVLARAERGRASEQSFHAARELAGPGVLRLDAIYNLGTSALFEGETERAKIPEVQGQPPQVQPALPGPPAGGGTAPGGAPLPPPDPLALARAAYLRAREHLVERVRTDWRDEDTRANLELVQRRLAELDEIEKKREEEKKKQEEQQKDEQDKKDQQQKNDQDKKDDEKKDDPKEDPKPDPEGKDQPKPDPEEKKPEEEKPAEDKPPEPKPKEAEPQVEQKLTKEEMTQLLDRLKELEEQARRLQEQMQRARRVKVKKDW